MKKIVLIIFVLAYAIVSKAQTTVEMHTSMGTITIILYDDTPAHRDNFLKLVSENYYDGLLFHRVIRNFMIQAGDPASANAAPEAHLGGGELGYTIPAEFTPQRFHKKGALAAARQADIVNPERASSSCQFYIVQGRTYTNEELDMIEKRIEQTLDSPFHFSDEQRRHYKLFGGTPHLDMQYTVFGEVVEGFNIVQKISEAETGKNDRPVNDIKINSIKIIKK